jgi:hypothetical protein
MRADSTFIVKSFIPADLVHEPPVETCLPVGVARIEKRFEGEVSGRSSTLFIAAYDEADRVGTYVAMESFEGEIQGRHGAFNFAHSSTTQGDFRSAEFLTIVPSSGSGELAGIRGSGGLSVDADGTHRIWFEYELG